MPSVRVPREDGCSQGCCRRAGGPRQTLAFPQQARSEPFVGTPNQQSPRSRGSRSDRGNRHPRLNTGGEGAPFGAAVSKSQRWGGFPATDTPSYHSGGSQVQTASGPLPCRTEGAETLSGVSLLRTLTPLGTVPPA